MLGPKFIRLLLGGVVPQGPHSDLGQHQGHNDIYIQYTYCYNEGGEGDEEEAKLRKEKREAKKTNCSNTQRAFIDI